MATKTGELRETLMDAITAIKSKRLDASEAGAIAKLAGAINASLMAELAIRTQSVVGKTAAFGGLSIGDEGPA